MEHKPTAVKATIYLARRVFSAAYPSLALVVCVFLCVYVCVLLCVHAQSQFPKLESYLTG